MTESEQNQPTLHAEDVKQNEFQKKAVNDELVVELNEDIYTLVAVIYHQGHFKRLTKAQIFVLIGMALFTACIQLSCIIVISMEIAGIASTDVPLYTTYLILTRMGVALGLEILICNGFGDLLNTYILVHNVHWRYMLYYFPGIAVNYAVSATASITSVTLLNFQNTAIDIYSQGLLLYFILEIDDWAYNFVSKMSFGFRSEMFRFTLRKEDITDNLILHESAKTLYLFGCFVLVCLTTVVELLDQEILYLTSIMGTFWGLIGAIFLGRYAIIYFRNASTRHWIQND